MLKRALIALLIVAAVLALIDWASSFAIPCPAQPIVHSTSGQEEQRKTTQKGCPAPGVIVQGLALIWRAADWAPEAWTAAATIAIAGFTLILAIATFVQARLTREAIRLSERALHSVERAFIFLRDIEITKRLNDRDVSAWRFTPIWENSGSTPAKHMMAHVCATTVDITPPNVVPSDGSLPENFAFPDVLPTDGIDATAGPNNYVMGPKSFLPGETIEMHVVTLGHVRRGARRAYIWGWVDYDDILNGTIRHRTEFCREILFTTIPTGSNETPIRFRAYRRHNGADDECLRPPEPYVAPRK